jgi:imidazolonepropionase-like amidohydrolase
MMRFLLRCTFAAVALALSQTSPASAQDLGSAPLEVLYGFTLIDGRGGPPIEDAAMAIRGNEILTVSSRRELLSGPDAPREAVAVNLGGGFVIPGLIDSHVHLATAPNRERAEAELYRMLYAGITGVRDMAGDGRALAGLARDSRLGVIDAPDVYFSALMAGPSFLADPRPQSSAAGETAGEVPWMQAITRETDLVTAVAQAKGTYATGIKVYANLEPEIVRDITTEAHRQGMRVWAHSMVFPTRPLEVVNSGVDVVSHVCRLAWEGMAAAPTEYHHDQVPPYDNLDAESAIFTELFDAMQVHGTVLDATLAMYARAAEDPDNPLSDRCDIDFARALVGEAHRQGIPIIAGTDFSTPRSDPYPALHGELEELVNFGGLSPMDAIGSATRVAAEAIGVSDKHGVLEHGRPVTFVLLDRNPLDDIGNLRSVKAVWKNGERFERSAYRAPAPEEEVRARQNVVLGPASAQQALDQWLAMWRRYDLDVVDDVFLQDPALTFFASDTEDLIEGFADVRSWHEAQGFVSGGFRPEDELWLEDALVAAFDGSAVVAATWRFGSRITPDQAATGPLTMTIVSTATGYRIVNLSMPVRRAGG